jgi:hypothetical protein
MVRLLGRVNTIQRADDEREVDEKRKHHIKLVEK